MSGFNTDGIGRDHARLAEVARQLDADGYVAEGVFYRERADTETEIWQSVTDLGQKLIHLAQRSGAGATTLGADLADWLVKNDWTPPDHFAGRIEE